MSLKIALVIVGSVLAMMPLGSFSAFAQQDVWRHDTTLLRTDRARVRSCIKSADSDRKLDACKYAIWRACEKLDAEPLEIRKCGWRGIAAWEDEMKATIKTLVSTLDHDGQIELGSAQRSWTTSMLADVLLSADLYKGGTFAGMLAAETRADETAARTIFLEKTLRQAREH